MEQRHRESIGHHRDIDHAVCAADSGRGDAHLTPTEPLGFGLPPGLVEEIIWRSRERSQEHATTVAISGAKETQRVRPYPINL